MQDAATATAITTTNPGVVRAKRRSPRAGRARVQRERSRRCGHHSPTPFARRKLGSKAMIAHFRSPVRRYWLQLVQVNSIFDPAQARAGRVERLLGFDGFRDSDYLGLRRCRDSAARVVSLGRAAPTCSFTLCACG